MNNPGTGCVNVQSVSCPKGCQDAAVACSYYIFLRHLLRKWEPQALVNTLERSACQGIRVTVGQCFNTNPYNKLVSCGSNA